MSRLSDYRIKKTIGEGATSKVKLVEHVRTHKEYAMKIIKPREEIQKQIDREISILQILASENNSSQNSESISQNSEHLPSIKDNKIRHENLVNLHEIIRDKKKIYLILDYVSNGDLEEKISSEGGSLDESEARVYFRQLIKAIEFLHSKSITHRDLKLENLLIDKNGNLRLADFGLSIMAQTDLSTHCGTPYYVAPEVFFCAKYDGPPADIWSCGIILFVMLAGYFPFEGKDFDDLGRKVMKGKIDFPSYFSTNVIDLIQGILTKDPAQRFTIEQIKNHSWYKGHSATLTPTSIIAFDDLIIDLDDQISTQNTNINHKIDVEAHQTNENENETEISHNNGNHNNDTNELNTAFDSDEDSTSSIRKSDNSRSLCDTSETGSKTSSTYTEEEEEENIIPINLQFRPNDSVVKIPVAPQRLSSTSSASADIEPNSSFSHYENSIQQSDRKSDGTNKKPGKKSSKNVFTFNMSQFDVYQIIMNYLHSSKAKIANHNSQNDKKKTKKEKMNKKNENNSTINSSEEAKIEASIKLFIRRVKFAIEINQNANNATIVTVTKQKGSGRNFKRILKSMRSSFDHC